MRKEHARYAPACKRLCKAAANHVYAIFMAKTLLSFLERFEYEMPSFQSDQDSSGMACMSSIVSAAKLGI